MKGQSKFNEHEETRGHLDEQQVQRPATLEFDSPEAMLRHDALHTPVPPTIALRLKDSLAQLPPPARRPWWRRLFGQ